MKKKSKDVLIKNIPIKKEDFYGKYNRYKKSFLDKNGILEQQWAHYPEKFQAKFLSTCTNAFLKELSNFAYKDKYYWGSDFISRLEEEMFERRILGKRKTEIKEASMHNATVYLVKNSNFHWLLKSTDGHIITENFNYFNNNQAIEWAKAWASSWNSVCIIFKE